MRESCWSLLILAAAVGACVHADPPAAAAPKPSTSQAQSVRTPATAADGGQADRAPATAPPRSGAAPVDLGSIGYEPVPCKTDRDCWFSRTPDLHPVRRPKNVRRKFRPCVDGEAAPECKQGRCGFGMPIPC
jgi:hypothetical protein